MRVQHFSAVLDLRRYPTGPPTTDYGPRSCFRGAPIFDIFEVLSVMKHDNLEIERFEDCEI